MLAAALVQSSAPVQRPAPADTALARAESLLAAGDLAAARGIAERLASRRPDDVPVLVVLGRIHLAWPVIGRFAAESLFRRAAGLAPRDPAPRYWLGRTGLALGGDDGEMTARWGLERALALDPDYRDAWTLWLRLYRGDGDRRQALAALAPHAGRYDVDLRRAQLLVELRRYGEAEPLLGSLAAERPGDVAPRVLLVRALFEQDRDVEAAALYDDAMRLAATDTAQLLWRQLRSTASPAERDEWVATPPEGREAFLRLFWARRDPALATALNERMGEHFRRMAEAQRDFRILHPNARWHRSKTFRSLAGTSLSFGDGQLSAITRRARAEQCTARLPGSANDAAVVAGLTPRLDTLPDDATPNLEDGLDDRGRVWIRHGRPDVRTTYGTDGETWCYIRQDGVLRVTFVRRTGFGGVSGDMVFTPVQAGEAESAALLTATETPSRRPTLEFSFWLAAFRSADGRRTDVLVFPDSLAAVAALLDASGREVARDSATGRYLRLVSSPGRYLLMLDAERRGAEGRYRGATPVPDFGGGALAVSSLLIGEGRLPADRDVLAAAAPAGLRLPVHGPLRVYAEVYGLGRRDDVTRYEARYRFERIDGGFLDRGRERVTTVSFPREGRYAPRVVESLVVDPGRLPAGRYRLVLEIVDLVRGQAARGAAMEFQLR